MFVRWDLIHTLWWWMRPKYLSYRHDTSAISCSSPATSTGSKKLLLIVADRGRCQSSSRLLLQVAVKVIDKTKLDPVARAHLFQEVRCMKMVQHPNVVRLYEVIDTATKLYLILELGDGGDMYDCIMKHDGGLTEEVGGISQSGGSDPVWVSGHPLSRGRSRRWRSIKCHF